MSRKTRLGIDVGLCRVKAALLECPNGSPGAIRGLWQADLMPERQSIKEDTPVADVERVVCKLLEQVQAVAPDAPREALTSLQGYGSWCQYLEFPPLHKDELETAVRTKVRKHIPFPPETVQLSYVPVPQISHGRPRTAVFVAAAHRETVAKLTRLLKKCNVELKGIDVTALALVREFVRNHDIPEGRIVGLLNVGYGLSQFIVVLNGFPYYVRDFAPAGGQFTYGFQVGLQVDWNEAERSKRAYDTTQRMHYVELFLKRWMEEIKRTLHHFSSQFSEEGLSVAEIYLSGGTACWNGVAGRLADFLDLPVHVDGWDRLSAPPRGDADGNLYKVAVGIALEG